MLYVLSDLHLSESCNKSMEVFGYRWKDYTNKIITNWNTTVTDNDTVVIPGDVSWGMSLEEAKADFALLQSLPGKKILGKGNHDYWWDTVKKMTAFNTANGFDSISFLYNNAYLIDGCAVCGSRGWFNDEKLAPDDADYAKILAREAGRLEMSINAAEKLGGTPVVFLHFPPAFKSYTCREILDVLHLHNIKDVYYGHIHNVYDIEAQTVFEDITFHIVSADYLNFSPMRIIK